MSKKPEDYAKEGKVVIISSKDVLEKLTPKSKDKDKIVKVAVT